MTFYNNYYFSLILLPLLHITILLNSKVVSLSSSCQSKCGNVKIPYPFGIQEGCYFNEWYKIECRNGIAPFLLKTGMEVVDIILPGLTDDHHFIQSFGSVRVKNQITSAGCSSDGNGETGSVLNLTNSPFYILGDNNLVAVGCSSKVTLTNIKPWIVGCELKCTTSSRETSPFVRSSKCSTNVLTYFDEDCNSVGESKRRCDGNGCCTASLPYDLKQMIGVSIENYDNGNSTSRKCSVAFLTDEAHLPPNETAENLFEKKYVTFSIKWVLQTKNLSFVDSLSCKTAREYRKLKYTDINRYITSCTCNNATISGTNYATCGCNDGYRGNPYLYNGCKNIDECQQRRSCAEGQTCVNKPGHYSCAVDKSRPIKKGVGTSFGTLILVGALWWLIKFVKKRRVIQRKRKFFKRNGGLLLQQQLNTREGNIEKTRIFTSDELEKATENFSENRILGQGGQGTVYKGMLADGKTVAVKKSKLVDEDKVQEFINEVDILSQVNHRHVVKLFGCCLETEVPVLVYEFIPNGNLFQNIHEEFDDYTMIWGVRLRIAVDIAGALSYLHSSANSPIYHRDVKSTNILLDEKYRAKVSDFGTSRSVTIDHTHWTTMISGTIGYMDPEYYGSSQYTDKSDVYSFGVVLVELITGEKPVITLLGSQEIRGLADHFRAAMKENRFFDIMDSRIKDGCKREQVMAVANLARRCLNSKGKKRPYMQQVFTELQKIHSSSEGSFVNVENDNGPDEEDEEGMNIIDMADAWTNAVTAPTFGIAASSSSSDVVPLFPRSTW